MFFHQRIYTPQYPEFFKKKGGGGLRVRLSLIANPTPIDAEFLDEAELLDLGVGGGGDGMG